MEEGVACALWWLPTVLASVPVQSSGEVAQDGHADDGQRDLSLTAASPSLSPPPSPPPSPLPPTSRRRRLLNNVLTSKDELKTAAQAYNTDHNAAIETYGPIAGWDVSGITDMSEVFSNLQNFNADISSWDTSKVTNMQNMFYGASAFNQPLSFDTSSVTTMVNMFSVRSSPCPAPSLQSRPPLHALLAAAVVHRLLPPTRTPRPAPHALLSILGSTRRRSTSR